MQKERGIDVEPKASQPRIERIEALTVKQLTAIEVGLRWYKLYPCLRDLYGNKGEKAMTNIMGAIASGQLTVFELSAIVDGKSQFVGVAITQIVTQSYTGEKVCNLYGLWALHQFISAQAWVDAYAEMERFARENGCVKLEAMTENPRAQKLLQHLGFKLRTHAVKGL